MPGSFLSGYNLTNQLSLVFSSPFCQPLSLVNLPFILFARPVPFFVNGPAKENERKRKVDRLLANQSLLLGGYTVSSPGKPHIMVVS